MKKVVDKDLFLSVLNSSSSKREAKSYVSRFKPRPRPSSPKSPRSDSDKTNEQHAAATTPRYRHGVNLGNLFRPTVAVEQSPVFSQHGEAHTFTDGNVEPLHVALVKLRAPETYDDLTLKGIGRTLSQLNQLGLPSAVIVDCDSSHPGHSSWGSPALRNGTIEQADRIVAAIEANRTSAARRVDGLISVSPDDAPSWSGGAPEGVHINPRSSLLHPLKRGTIPVIPPIGYYTHTQKTGKVDPNAAMLALARELVGLSPSLLRDGLEGAYNLQREVSLDRIIIVDPLGGIPSNDTSRGGHVFINMEQEFEHVHTELAQEHAPDAGHKNGSEPASSERARSAAPQASTPINDSVQLKLPAGKVAKGDPKEAASTKMPSSLQHLSNLRLLQHALTMLPSSSSALLTTPERAAGSGDAGSTAFQAAGVGTRRQRNTLIHNLLTDKAPFSSSLPAGRIGASSADAPFGDHGARSTVPVTFVKRGLPLTILPDPRRGPWKPCGSQSRITLHDPRIDLSRLIDLIEDSFGRKLDVKHYLARVNRRVAGIIVAGEYEGGALLTWELPPGLGNELDSAADRHRLVPYLDKFAVRRRSQGAGGVADMVFTAMVRSCFPEGVCWRSRKNNPVNRWYFERARGTWKLPDTDWTMFWTDEDLGIGSRVFADYEAVCRGIEPSWADNKHVVD